MSNAPATNTLHLICYPNWMADELAKASAYIPVEHSYGLDVPSFNEDDIWWMPQEVAVHINRSIVASGRNPLRLSSPGDFLLALPRDIVGRRIASVSKREAVLLPQEGWWKSAEAKVDNFTSAWRTEAEFLEDASFLPDNARLHVSDRKLDIEKEYRSFIVDGRAVTTSVYLDNSSGEPVTVYDGASASADELRLVARFVDAVLGSQIEQPRGFVVDTALLRDGSLVVLECNPSWCSAWYDCSIVDVARSIQASFLDEKWGYAPDDYLVKKVAPKPNLRLS